jgi:glutamyl-tRNA synthetase
MRSMPVEELTRLLIEWLEKPEADGGLPDQVQRPIDFDYTVRIVPLISERVKLLTEAKDMMAFFYLAGSIEPDVDLMLGKAFKDDRRRAALLLSEALVAAEKVEVWEHEVLEEAFRDLAQGLEVRAGDLFMLMRVAITGRAVAPPLFETMAIIGKERCVQRLREAVALL